MSKKRAAETGARVDWRERDQFLKAEGPRRMGSFLAHPQFLKKSPSKIRSLERRGDLMGFRAEKFGSSS